MSKIHRFYDIFARHKYLVTILLIVLIVGFVDENSYWNRRERQAHINSLLQQKKAYDDQYKADTRELMRLRSHDYLERYGREHYHMKRADEDVYIME